MSARQICHLLLSLETPVPLCGTQGILTTYCTVNPLLATCPDCRKAKISLEAPSSQSEPGNKFKVIMEGVHYAMPEKSLLEAVRGIARGAGFLTYHAHRSERSEPGWFDLALCRPGSPLYLAELKTRRGKLTKEQDAWYNAVSQCTGVQCFVWRPSDLPEIVTLFHR